MPAQDTPPASPSASNRMENDVDGAEADNEAIEEGDVVEVIDLDQELGDEEEDMEEAGEGELPPPPEDNSERDFEDHSGSKNDV